MRGQRRSEVLPRLRQKTSIGKGNKHEPQQTHLWRFDASCRRGYHTLDCRDILLAHKRTRPIKSRHDGILGAHRLGIRLHNWHLPVRLAKARSKPDHHASRNPDHSHHILPVDAAFVCRQRPLRRASEPLHRPPPLRHRADNHHRHIHQRVCRTGSGRGLTDESGNGLYARNGKDTRGAQKRRRERAFLAATPSRLRSRKIC